MTSPSKRNWWLSAVILALGAVGGLAAIAVTALPHRMGWPDPGVSSVLAQRLETLADSAADVLFTSLVRVTGSIAATTEPFLPPPIAPKVHAAAERMAATSDEFASVTSTPPAVAVPVAVEPATTASSDSASVTSASPAVSVPAAPGALVAAGTATTAPSDSGSVTAVPPVVTAPVDPVTEVEPERNAVGVIRSQEQATLASRMTALITFMPLEAGQTFKRGETLIAFDCLQLRAQLKAADAAVEAYRTTYDTNVELDQYKAIGINEVRVSRANVNKAAAEADALRVATSQCHINAPFDGSVVERKANQYDVAASGQPLMMIQSNGNLEVELIVPSSWLVWIEPGIRFRFHLEETGQMVGGKVTRLGATVDPVSKTVRIIGEIESEGRVMPGMSGVAHFDVSERTPSRS